MPTGQNEVTDALSRVFNWLLQNNPGRAQAEQLGDMEFGQAIAPYLDPADRRFIDPNQAKYVGTKTWVPAYGYNTTSAEKPTTLPAGRGVLTSGARQLTLDPGYIYAIGPHGAQPRTWAHEFRHNSPTVWGVLNHMQEELRNRMEDSLHAQTTEDADQADLFLMDIMKSMYPEQSEDQLRKILQDLLTEFQAGHETDQRRRTRQHRQRQDQEVANSSSN